MNPKENEISKKRNYEDDLSSLSNILLVFLFVEFLILNSFYLSFQGYYTERLIFYLYLITGFLSLKKGFFVTLFTFIILSMIPMMIPFIMILCWMGGGDKCYYFDNGKRLQEIRRFGQEPSDLALIEKKNLFLEETTIQFNIGICNIELLSSIKSVELKNQIIKIESENDFISTLDEKIKQPKCTCEIDLQQNTIKTNDGEYKFIKKGNILSISYKK